MTIKDFIKHIILIILFIGIVLALVLFWLRIYTNHGQQLSMGEYVGMNIDDAKEEADDKSFILIISDSVHVVGKAGGEIISQNPKPNSKVKENRKVYVTTTKYNADKILVKNLPTLYGTDYYSKCKDLGYQNINCEIRSYQYDAGEKDHILEAYYKGQMIISRNARKGDVEIEKGGTISFVLSKKDGGEFEIPEYRCSTLDAALFAIEQLKFNVGEITENGPITDRDKAYIVDQDPKPLGSGKIAVGDFIRLTIQQSKPKNCQ